MMKKQYVLGLAFLCLNATAAHQTGKSLPALEKSFRANNAWGLHTTIDLKGCNPEFIRSAKTIEQYIKQLCDLIQMKRFGEPRIVHFGEDDRVAGYSMVQLIETSLISGHFANASNAAYIDVFSCKFYNPYLIAEFTKTFFAATSYEINVIFRK